MDREQRQTKQRANIEYSFKTPSEKDSLDCSRRIQLAHFTAWYSSKVKNDVTLESF
jgi:hypothetical protein